MVETDGGAVRTGFDEICARLAEVCRGRAKTVLTVECYPGVDQRELLQGLQPLQPALVVHSDDLAFESEKIDALLAQDMTDDPVFGILTVRRLEDYFYPEKIDAARRQIAEAAGLVLVFGVGASLVHPGDVQVLAEQYVNRIPVKKHDHVLIPAGTVHCSGAGTMVLEISATPYIFTFKLWDWGRVDLDGKPRPIHIDRGLANIQWDRDTEWVRDNLIGRETQVYADDGCTVERTGLHEREFIDTFRVSTAREASIRRNGSVHVLNLVESRSAQLVSTTGAFAPFALHYAETCIVPEAAGDYKIVSEDGRPVKAVIACVRG